MTFVEAALWGAAAITAGAVIIAIARQAIFAFWPEAEAAELYERFLEQCTAAGLTYPEAMAEWYVRAELARVRREATDAVLADPDRWKQSLDGKIQEALERMAKDRPDLIPAFKAMITGLSYAHILYPDATRLVDRLPVVLEPVDPLVRQDMTTALRVIRGGR